MNTAEATLEDLPEEKTTWRPPILTPKIIILMILSVYFVGTNVYNYLYYYKPIE